MNANSMVTFTKPREVVVEAGPIPSPGSGEVLIKSKCTLISTGTELTILGADFPPDSLWAKYAEYPWYPGYDNIGEVVEVGGGVGDEWIGRTVATYGPHAHYFTWDVKSAYPVPKEIPPEEAVFFTIGEIVLHGIRRSGLRLGESAAVYGLGLLGQLTVRLSRLCGAWPVVGIDLSESRLARLPNDPGIVPVNPREKDVEKVVDDVTKGRKADVVFELTGEPEVIPHEFSVLRYMGRFVVLSNPRGKTVYDFNDCNMLCHTIIGAQNFSHPEHPSPDNPWTRARDVELFFDLLLGRQLDTRPLISRRCTARETSQVYSDLLKDRSETMGVLIDWK